MMNDSLRLSKRSSVATIVGTFFFLVVMLGGFAALIAGFELNSDLLEGQFKISQQETQKVQENFTIQAAYDSIVDVNTGDNNLCVTIDNTGAVPLEIPDLFIVNSTAAASTATLIPISYKDSFVPMGSTKNILESRIGTTDQITLEDTEHTLKIKAVTTSGIAKTTELKVFSSSSTDPRLDVTAFVFPKNLASGQEAVIGMIVHNAGNTTLLEVQPSTATPFLGDPTVIPSTAVSDDTGGFSLTTDTTIARLDPDEDVTFMWDPEIIGGTGSTLTFTVGAQGKVLECDGGSSVITSATDTESLKVVPGVRREIFARPQLLITFPNPFGESTETGYWAVTAVNPTDQPVDVQQVSIQIQNAANKDILKNLIIAIEPNADWSINKNVMFWSNFASPITVQPFDGAEFIVRSQPSVSAPESPINMVVFSIFSSFGQFNVVPFTFGYFGSATAIANVYMNTTAASGGDADFLRSSIGSAETATFNITLANLGASGTVINSDASFLINIPPGWTSITNGAVVPVGGMTVGTHVDFADGSTQIPVRLASSISPEEGGRTFTFTMQAPSVSTTALYILTLTAEGTATGGVIIGPLSEAALQVCPIVSGSPDCDV